MGSTKRPTVDQYFLKMAVLVSSRSTCARRAVGCVLVNRNNHVLSTGYNGVASGLPHCNEGGASLCEGWKAPSGSDLDQCQAIHAEQNALLQCPNVYEIYTAYITASPCVHCVKLLMGTTCKRIMFIEEYPHEIAKKLWLLNPRRTWIKEKLL